MTRRRPGFELLSYCRCPDSKQSKRKGTSETKKTCSDNFRVCFLVRGIAWVSSRHRHRCTQQRQQQHLSCLEELQIKHLHIQLDRLPGLGLYMRQALFGTQAVCNQTVTQGLDLYPESYMETYPGANLVANDEIIAHTLQEEFESLAADETSEAASPIVPVFENLQALMSQIWDNGVALATRTGRVSTHWERDGVIQYWDEGAMETVGEGNYSADDEAQDAPHDESDKDDPQQLLALSEDLPHDKEVARRLTKLDSVPHIPKTNGNIPAQDIASEDHQRLLDRLKLYGLSEQRIEGDGNCQFRALSDQLYRSPEHHKFVRDSVVKQLTETPDAYSGYVPMQYDDYLENMAKNGEWGDHVTLQAASDYYGVKISLITSFKDTCFIEIVPKQHKSKREIHLSFWAEVHYNSIYPLENAAEDQSHSTRKKKHWLY